MCSDQNRPGKHHRPDLDRVPVLGLQCVSDRLCVKCLAGSHEAQYWTAPTQ